MRFRYAIMYVEDVAASLAFYEFAFGLTRSFLHESGDYGELETGSTRLAFSARRLIAELGKSPSRPDPEAPTCEIAFETDDVASALARAEATGARVMQGVKQEVWGQTTAYVADPDGFLVELCTPVAPPA